MMKFTMNAKDLKVMMEKGIAAINKKATLSTLTRLYFQIDENGILKVWGTDMEHWAEVRTDNAYDTQPGVLGIDVDDIKIISKMGGEITLEDVTTEDMEVGKINIKCRKKIVTIPRYQDIDIFLPSMDDNPEENYGLSDRYIKFLKKNTIKYHDRLCNLNRQQYLSGYGWMQGYFSIGEVMEKLKKEGTVKVPFSWLYDIRQYDKAMNGCYMEITKI